MGKLTKHAYKITYSDHDNERLQVGGILVDKNHVRKEHEPHRVWNFFNFETGEERTVTARHIGEFEKVRELLSERIT